MGKNNLAEHTNRLAGHNLHRVPISPISSVKIHLMIGHQFTLTTVKQYVQVWPQGSEDSSSVGLLSSIVKSDTCHLAEWAETENESLDSTHRYLIKPQNAANSTSP